MHNVHVVVLWPLMYTTVSTKVMWQNERRNIFQTLRTDELY